MVSEIDLIFVKLWKLKFSLVAYGEVVVRPLARRAVRYALAANAIHAEVRRRILHLAAIQLKVSAVHIFHKVAAANVRHALHKGKERRRERENRKRVSECAVVRVGSSEQRIRK